MSLYLVLSLYYYDTHTLDTQVDVHVSSLCFSPDGTHLAAALSTGEVQVFERCSGNSLFNIGSPEVWSVKVGFNYVHCIGALTRSVPPTYCTQSSSPVTSIAYSLNGKLFAAGYQNGVLQLWKGMTIKLSFKQTLNLNVLSALTGTYSHLHYTQDNVL